jgi:integrase
LADAAYEGVSRHRHAVPRTVVGLVAVGSICSNEPPSTYRGRCLGYPSKRKDGPPIFSAGAKTKAGITRRVRFHDLRHTTASHLVLGSWGRCWKLIEVRDFLGHSTLNVTERYAHLGPDALHAAARETHRDAASGGGKPDQDLTENPQKSVAQNSLN